MSRVTSDLPFGSEFSPSQIDLPELLELAEVHSGDRARLQAAIQNRYFADHGRGDGESARKNRRTLAMNCRLGMKAYGLIDDKAALTALGQQLRALKDHGAELYDALARHILLNLNGMALVRCIQEMFAAAEKVTLDSLRVALAERGIRFPPGGKHPSMMRLWLAKAGVFIGAGWQVDELRIEELLGLDSDEYAQLARFTPEQRAFVLTLANTGVAEPQPANEVAKLAAATYGVRFPDKSLPKLVLDALAAAGYLVMRKTTKGRGAKPFLVAPTAKLQAEIVAPLFDQLKWRLDPKLLDLLTKPLATIVAEIDAKDRYIAGLALEALAFKLMRLLGMDYVATRLRAEATGGAEVDLVFESARLVFSRWQIQCKNTGYVSLDDVAKEVGLTHSLKSNVIVVVSTGQISADARRYANKIMRDSNLSIVLMDRPALEGIVRNPAFVVDVFR